MTPVLQAIAPYPKTHVERWRIWAVSAATFVGLLGWTVLLQWIGGAYSAEFSGYPDEPSHYLSGLMIRDYLASGFPVSPVPYAENYYLHYPKIAFGMWGPLPHVAEGIWMLIFSPARWSILLLMAIITTTLAFTLAQVIWAEFNLAAGVAVGMTLVAVKLVQSYASMVMADNLCALMEFWAILWFGRYLHSERTRDSVLFGVFACLSALTKGNGFALALVPPIAILITRRFDLLKRWNFWIPVPMMAFLVGPWQYLSTRLLTGLGIRQVSWAIASAYGPMFVSIVGPWLLPFVFVGIYDRIIRPFRKREVEGRWAAAAALPLAFWIFHAVTPSAGAESRYVVAVVAPLLMFFTAGLARVAQWLPPARVPFRIRATILATVAAMLFVRTSFAIPAKESFGFSELARDITGRADLQGSVIFVSSEGYGEGMLVSEIAMHDHRPGLIVLRATKMLARINWDGDNYALLHPDPEEMMKLLQEIPVRLLVIDRTPGPGPLPHHRNLLTMLTKYPDRWQLMATYPQKMHATAANSKIEVYRLKGQENRPRSKIRLDLRYTLGRWIEK